MTDDLVAFLRARLDEDETEADKHQPDAYEPGWELVAATEQNYPCNPYLQVSKARVLAEVDTRRRIIDMHAPEFSTVEWPDDQTGKGEAYVCRSCGNRDIDQWMNWRPAIGEAGSFPQGVKPPYVIAPCDTLRLLASPYSNHPEYQPEWAPDA